MHRVTLSFNVVFIGLLLINSYGGSLNSQNSNQEKKPGFFNRARFETQYDKFKDLTTVRFKPLPISGTGARVMRGEEISLMGAFQFKGKSQTETVDTFLLGFISTSKDWIFLKDSHFITIVDEEKIDIGNADRDSDVKLGGVKELLVYKIPLETMTKFANGKSVEIQVGSREFKLRDHHLWALRELINQTKSQIK